MKKYFYLIILLTSLISCISTKSTLQNVDPNAPLPEIKKNAFVITTYAESAKYGYNEDFPINIGPIVEQQENLFMNFFFNGIEGKNKAPLTYKKVASCCPFPSKNQGMGAGTLSIYEVTNTQTKETKKLYFNIYERGKIECPKGFFIKDEVK